MNATAFIFVFTLGLAFALILPLLKQSLECLNETNLSHSLNSILSHTSNDLLDPGYVTMNIISMDKGNTALSRKLSTEIEQKNDVTDAESCLRIGEQLLEAGKVQKASKLLERAVALAPYLPQALLALGECIEKHHSDVVRADQLYVRALMLAPHNAQAIRNRIRTKSIVATHDLTTLKQISMKKIQLSHVPDSAPALKRIQNEAYYYHIHHTVAIEGNTMTLEEIRTILETGLSIGGKSVTEHTEVLGVDSALRFINSSLLHRVGALTLPDLLALHLRVLGHTDPPAAGHLRTTQVFVGPHLPPPPSRLTELMEQFMDWLNAPKTVALHPVRYAALAHYHLVYIHPFTDGNGRTARLLMNFLLMQAGYPPIIIRHQDRLQYYDTLQAANEGDTRPFVRFISHCTEKTLDVYLWATQDDIPALGEAPEVTALDRKGRHRRRPGDLHHRQQNSVDEDRRPQRIVKEDSLMQSAVGVDGRAKELPLHRDSEKIAVNTSSLHQEFDDDDNLQMREELLSFVEIQRPNEDNILEEYIGIEEDQYNQRNFEVHNDINIRHSNGQKHVVKSVGTNKDKKSPSANFETETISNSHIPKLTLHTKKINSGRLPKIYSKNDNEYTDAGELNPLKIGLETTAEAAEDYLDDLGILFSPGSSEVEPDLGPGVLHWLNGEGSEEYAHSSRYYSRHYINPDRKMGPDTLHYIHATKNKEHEWIEPRLQRGL